MMSRIYSYVQTDNTAASPKLLQFTSNGRLVPMFQSRTSRLDRSEDVYRGMVLNLIYRYMD
jgi:hypothetical protein